MTKEININFKYNILNIIKAIKEKKKKIKKVRYKLMSFKSHNFLTFNRQKQGTLKFYIYQSYFSAFLQYKNIIEKKTYKVLRNFYFRYLDLKNYLYKKFLVHNGIKFEYFRINFDFLNTKVGAFSFTKKLGMTIHTVKKKKKKKNK